MTQRQDRKDRAPARRALLWLALVGVAVLSSSCQKPFDVNVKADEPLKVDMTMDVHVYQHGGAAIKKSKELDRDGTEVVEYKQVMERRRDRMADIQTLKNDRIIGENHSGLLSQRVSDGDSKLWPMDYVRNTITDENVDRSYLIDYESTNRNKPIFEIQREQWILQQRKSHPGEWIEIDDPDNLGKYIWVQKKTPVGSTSQSG